jgi:hypothetical protein
MIQIPKELKQEAAEALLKLRENYDGSDAAFAKQWDINGSVYSRLKNGQLDGLLSEASWINICRELNIGVNAKKWNTARTDVFVMIEEDINFCKEHSKARIFVDECEIGKTHAAKYLSRTLKNCFYVDGSQCKTKQKFIRKLAQALGVDGTGTYDQVKENIKYCLKLFPKPIIIIDEAGDLEYTAFLELKELWNATEGFCGWYLIGADGLRQKIERGIFNKKVGYRELLSRFSNNFSSAVPNGRDNKVQFYKKLISDVLSVNAEDKSKVGEIVKSCLKVDEHYNIGGLRRAESLLILNS